MKRKTSRSVLTKVADKIYIGNFLDVNEKILRKNKISAVLNVAADIDDEVFDGIISIKCGCYDRIVGCNPVREAANILTMLMRNGHTVLVHCHTIPNRASCVVANHLAATRGTGWKDEFHALSKIEQSVFMESWMDYI